MTQLLDLLIELVQVVFTVFNSLAAGYFFFIIAFITFALVKKIAELAASQAGQIS